MCISEAAELREESPGPCAGCSSDGREAYAIIDVIDELVVVAVDGDAGTSSAVLPPPVPLPLARAPLVIERRGIPPRHQRGASKGAGELLRAPRGLARVRCKKRKS